MKKAGERGEVVLLCLLLLVAALAAYSNSFSTPFVFDDLNLSRSVYEPGWANVRRAILRSTRVVVDLSFILNRALGGFDVRGYHVVNFGVHLGAAFALLGLLRRTPGGRPLALPAALLFVVHPLQTESVTYVSQRAQSFMGFFELLSFYCVARANGSERRRAWHAGAVASFLLAMVSKPQVVLMPPLVLLYERAFFAASVKDALRRSRELYLALFSTWLLAALYVVYRLARVGWADVGEGGRTPASYAAAQVVAIPLYLWRSVFPATLVFDYGWKGVAWWQTVLGGAFVAGLVAGTVVAWRRSPPVGFIGAWFFLNLAPISSVIPRVDLAVEHRMYVPLISIIVGAVALGRRLPSNAARATFAIVITILIARTRVRNEDYASPGALWRATVAAAPRNPRAHHNLATVYKEEKNYPAAIAHYTTAIESDPGYVEAWIDRGDVLARLGRHAEAVEDFTRAVDDERLGFRAVFNRGNAQRDLGRAAAAIADYTAAIERRPTLVDAVYNRACVHMNTGDFEKADADFTRALELRPDLASGFGNRGNCRLRLGRFQEARADFDRALALAPRAGTYFDRALAFASEKRFDEAWADVKRSRELGGEPDPRALEWLKQASGRSE